jgi:hypothetical protein
MISKYGSSGIRVEEITGMLFRLDYLKHPYTYYNLLVEDAVKRFQVDNNLLKDGIVGDATFTALKSLIFPITNETENLNDDGVESIAKKENVPVKYIRAIAEVESNGSGFIPDGRLKIRYEGHIFYKLFALEMGEGRALALSKKYPTLVYKNLSYKYNKTNAGEWDRFDIVKGINENIAYESTSFGTYQIMGFNYDVCGFKSAKAMAEFMAKSKNNQLICLIRFLKKNKLIDKLKKRDYVGFAKGYNGEKYYLNNYDDKIRKAVLKYS